MAAGRAPLWDLNCIQLETGYFQVALVWRKSLIKAVGHWHEDTTRGASVAEAEGEATSFKRCWGKRAPTAGAGYSREVPPGIAFSQDSSRDTPVMEM